MYMHLLKLHIFFFIFDIFYGYVFKFAFFSSFVSLDVQVRFHGYANVHWTEQRGSGHGSHTVHFRSHENYFDAKTVVLGKGKLSFVHMF